MRPPPTHITIPSRKCVRCGFYKPVLAGSQAGRIVDQTHQGGRGLARVPFVCRACNQKAAA